jgi:hypothetical protein
LSQDLMKPKSGRGRNVFWNEMRGRGMGGRGRVVTEAWGWPGAFHFLSRLGQRRVDASGRVCHRVRTGITWPPNICKYQMVSN